MEKFPGFETPPPEKNAQIYCAEKTAETNKIVFSEEKADTPETLTSIIQETKDNKNIGNIFIVYPSGLILEFTPIFDGAKSIESFTGTYSAQINLPKKYDQSRQKKLDKYQANDLIAYRDPRKNLPLITKNLKRTLSPKAKEYLPLDQRIQLVLSDHFSVTNNPLSGSAKDYLVCVDLEALKQSEKHIFAIFHELGHTLYYEFESQLVQMALEPENPRESDVDDIALGATNYIEAITEEFKKLDSNLVSKIYSKIAEIKKIRKKNSFESGATYLQDEYLTALHFLQDDYPELKKLLLKIKIFSEHYAHSRAIAMTLLLRRKDKGGIDLEFKKPSDITDFFQTALKSYEQAHQEPEFITGVPRKPKSRKSR